MSNELQTAIEAQGRAWEEFKKANDERLSKIEGKAADAAPAAPVAANPDAEAEITRLSGLLRASETLIAKLRAETADRDETITMLRADLDAQRTKAAQIPATAAGPAKAKPGRKPQPIPVETDDDLPTP